MRVIIIAALAVSIFIYSCSSSKYNAAQKTYFDKSKMLTAKISAAPSDSAFADSLKRPATETYTTNFGIRKPNMVILHYTAQNSCEKTLQTFTTASTEVSAHYVICKDGTLHHMLNDYLRAWHAGAGRWGSATDVNSTSIGIEIDNNGTENYSAAQLNSLYGLLAYLKKAYNIPTANFIGHSDIAPGRKVDPGILFPWKTLADKGYGIWYKDTTGISVPEGFSSMIALKLIGYDVSNMQAATNAFRMHYLGTNRMDILDEKEKKVLFAVMMRSLE